MCRMFFLTCILLCYPWLITAEVFSSVDQMQDIFSVERTLYDAIDNYINQEIERLKELRKLYEQKKDVLSDRAATTGVTNPSNAFSMINNADDGGKIVKNINSKTQHTTEFVKTITRFKSLYPTAADFNGSREAILRLQEVYQITPQAISYGRLPGHNSAHAQLTALDNFHIGRKAYENGEIELSKSWFKSTLRLMGTREDLRDFTGEVRVRRSDVLNHIAFLEYHLGNWSSSLDYYYELARRDPRDEQAQYNIREMQRLIAERQSNSVKPYNIDHDEVDEKLITYAELCRLNQRRNAPDETDRLTCSYFNQHPGLRLRPVAMETLNLSPRITLFHNVLSEREITEMLKLARPRLRRARVSNFDKGTVEPADYRISKNAWLREVDSDLVRRINKRVSFLTGLSTKSSEYLQINNYGIGGHYEPHYDHSLDMETSHMAGFGQGNRIATFMFYLSEVEAGGSTVFINAGVKATPLKGGAIFWYNLKKSGESDDDSLHAGCPVLLGNKWVANKWLHEYGNEFNRRCGLTPDE